MTKFTAQDLRDMGFKQEQDGGYEYFSIELNGKFYVSEDTDSISLDEDLNITYEVYTLEDSIKEEHERTPLTENELTTLILGYESRRGR